MAASSLSVFPFSGPFRAAPASDFRAADPSAEQGKEKRPSQAAVHPLRLFPCLPSATGSPDFWTSPRVCYHDTEKKPHAQGDTIGGTRDDSGNVGGRSPQQPPSPLDRCPFPGRVRGGDRAVGRQRAPLRR